MCLHNWQQGGNSLTRTSVAELAHRTRRKRKHELFPFPLPPPPPPPSRDGTSVASGKVRVITTECFARETRGGSVLHKHGATLDTIPRSRSDSLRATKRGRRRQQPFPHQSPSYLPITSLPVFQALNVMYRMKEFAQRPSRLHVLHAHTHTHARTHARTHAHTQQHTSHFRIN